VLQAQLIIEFPSWPTTADVHQLLSTDVKQWSILLQYLYCMRELEIQGDVPEVSLISYWRYHLWDSRRSC